MTNDAAIKNSILIVDDQPENIDFLVGHIGDEFNTTAATSGEKALKMASEHPQPNVILMDVMMPQMDGYETCQRIKSETDTKDIDVIFVSAKDSADGIILGYEAGGSDFLVKPIKPEELIHKINLVIKNKQIQAAIESEKTLAMETAMTAMISGGEQGVLLNFMCKCFEVQTVEDLAREITESCANYDLDVSVQIRAKHQIVNYNKNATMNPLEIEFLTKVKNAGRLREKGEYFVANFGDITLLVKNMPDDEGKRGRLRDHLAILIESAEIRLKALEMACQIAVIAKQSEKNLKAVEVLLNDFNKQFAEAVNDTMVDLEASFLSYGLSEDQELRLLEVAQSGINKSFATMDVGKLIDEKLRNIVTSLEDVLKN